MSETVWHDATEFVIEGRGWTDTASPYSRLPDRAEGVVNGEVWRLSHDSAGICVRFRTDAPQASVRWSLTGDVLAMPHMPATGVSGMDLYRRELSGRWRFVQNGQPSSQAGNVMEAALNDGLPAREYLLYLPLYNGVTSVEIGVPSGTAISAAGPRPPRRAKPILVYGTSIVQGGCASRPGLAWTAILGRRLDRPVINLGFSGSGRMEPEVSALLAELDPAVFVIDTLGNIVDQTQTVIDSRVKFLVHTVRAAHPTTPILFVGLHSVITERHPTAVSQWQEAVVDELVSHQVPALYTLSGEKLLGDDAEGTVDGAHPNDLGMMRQAVCIASVLRRLLR